MEDNIAQITKEDLWYIDNYIVLKDYYDRTISRIAARCIRMGNIAMEEYPFYSYILDVLEEICDTGNYIISKPEMYPYVERKIAGGIKALESNLKRIKENEKESLQSELLREEIYTDYVKVGDINSQISKIDEEINNIMTEWEELNEELDNIKKEIN